MAFVWKYEVNAAAALGVYLVRTGRTTPPLLVATGVTVRCAEVGLVTPVPLDKGLATLPDVGR